ncbi:MAG: beta-propeller fold lactonase family protein [Myxococcales bacterium]|nr:beta-propeller fold lactonase family protein [Myxococcales bacterium]
MFRFSYSALGLLGLLTTLWLTQSACPPQAPQESHLEIISQEPSSDASTETTPEITAEKVAEPTIQPDVNEPLPEQTTPEPQPEPLFEPLPEPTPEPQPEPIPEPKLPKDPYVLMMQTNGTITSYTLNFQDGTLQQRATTQRSGNMTFLAFHPNQPLFYATNRDKTQAFSFDPTNGKMAYLGEASNNPEGSQATHLTVDPSGKYIFVASYGGNRVSMHPLNAQGIPQATTFSRGGNNNQNFCVRAHQARVHPKGRFVYVPCLGSDHILRLQLDATQGSVTVQTPTPTQAGSGPRHLDFHPTKDVLYVVHELNSTVAAFQINPQDGQLTALQTISTLPQGTTEPSRSSDIHVSSDGRFVYAVNREPLNQIAIFSVQPDGKLVAKGHISTAGNHARSFSIHPLAPWLFLANAKSQDLVTFQINADGSLKQTNQISGLPSQPWFVGTWDF